jgi:hypothetical protein
MNQVPMPKPDVSVKKPSFLEQALGAQKIGNTLQQMKLKHGVTPLTEIPKAPKGKATHKGDIF